MAGKLFAHVRQQWIGTLALLLVLTGGTAYALDGTNTVYTDDIVDGEVRNDDLGADSVGSAKIIDKQVKNADLSIGASSSNTIADGGIQGVDVKNDTLGGAQINESTLFNDSSLNAGDIDEESLNLMQGRGLVLVRARSMPAGNFYANVMGPFNGDFVLPFNLRYICVDAPTSTNGAWGFENRTADAINLFVDNGSATPSYVGELAGNAEHFEAAFFGGDYLVFQAQYGDGRIVTIDAFSKHRTDGCHAQAQAVLSRVP